MARLRLPTHFARLPLRVRLTIAFAAVMTVVLGTAGVILYGQFASDLDADIDSALGSQAHDIAALVAAGRGASAVDSSGERFAQIYARDGAVLASTPRARGIRLLTTDQARRAARGELKAGDTAIAGVRARVRARAVRTPGDPAAVAVAETLERRDHALSRLRTLLLLAGPLALLLASIAGYELAGAALRSVERMRARAERITEHDLSERLPVPEANDEIGALGRTLNAMLERVEEAVARERRLVGDASHELRTPLSTLRAEVDLALMGERDPGELRAALESAAEEAERMTRLADDLLVLARADQGRLPIHAEPVRAGDLLDEVAARAAAAAAVPGRRIATDGDADLVALVDRDRALQALDNLVTNALRYGDGTITLGARADGDMVELHVTDEGRGFTPGLIAHAFERFGRGDDARSSGSGSGLGLSIVEALAAAHGGRAQARNRPGGGADVWIAVPRA